ncbi:MAG TPA: archease [Bdellovibrionales bacterium]|nr:MAG: hypothetical protein A2Z97_00910 [Bdellovibrionales bacterium GWB1_52_6]OFZ03082.1 MAG: hypothetical protein A2X97_09600 [Bdellovibrionales bacterium GWA1_52_35]OFZ40316.1 MAG: hypothetical protein A2070_10240 [Bdellovibrionales bacterium GWC1_52_8]HAR41807.1 archease [Bdellovibrionales bacterium]HCM40410.1 archease [Bdellovibrionales bacterium]
MSYRYLNNIALADAAFEALGSSIAEMFESAADALLSIMVQDVSSIRPALKRTIELKSERQGDEALEELLYGFLQKILYFKDADGLLLRPEKIKIDPSLRSLSVSFLGEMISDYKKEQAGALGADAKAITHHKFAISKTPQGWKAMVVVDV